MMDVMGAKPLPETVF